MYQYVCGVGLVFESHVYRDLGELSSGAVWEFLEGGRGAGWNGDGIVVAVEDYQRARLRPAPSSHEGRCLKESSLAEMRERAQRRHL